MSENNESGNRWEQPADAEGAGTGSATPPVVEPFETVAAQPPQEPPAETSELVAPTVTAPADAPRTPKLPSWVNKRGLVATGTAAAFFLGGGGLGYTIGANGHDDNGRPGSGRFDRSGFAPGQLPGGSQGGFQGPQNQSQNDDGSGSSSGTQS